MSRKVIRLETRRSRVNLLVTRSLGRLIDIYAKLFSLNCTEIREEEIEPRKKAEARITCVLAISKNTYVYYAATSALYQTSLVAALNEMILACGTWVGDGKYSDRCSDVDYP